MMTIAKVTMVGAAIGAFASAGPAASQYPAPGYPYGGSGNPYGFAGNRQIAVNRCSEAVQARLGGYGDAYGNGGGRVLGVSRVEPLGYGGAALVSGVASSGRFAADGYGVRTPVDLTWQCTADYRGFVMTLRIQPAQRAYGGPYYGNSPPYEGDDYSEYGYRRY